MIQVSTPETLIHMAAPKRISKFIFRAVTVVATTTAAIYIYIYLHIYYCSKKLFVVAASVPIHSVCCLLHPFKTRLCSDGDLLLGVYISWYLCTLISFKCIASNKYKLTTATILFQHHNIVCANEKKKKEKNKQKWRVRKTAAYHT